MLKTIDLINETPFSLLPFEASKDGPFHVIVARATYSVSEVGELVPLETQPEIVLGDTPYEVGQSIREESDLAPFKPMCDVVVIGKAIAPQEDVSRFDVGVTISKDKTQVLNQTLLITGKRSWKKRLLGWKLTPPEKIKDLSLRLENAFGGECVVRINDEDAKRVSNKFRLTPMQQSGYASNPPAAHSAFASNPFGKGCVEKWYRKAKRLSEIPAPQMESVADPIQKLTTYDPVGLGFRPKTDPRRLAFAGTMDDDFVKSGKSLPDDFDFQFWNGAFMQMPYPRGGESVTLRNLGMKSFKLPINRLCAVSEKERLVLDFNVDTIVINNEENTVALVYRLKLDEAPEQLTVEYLDPIEYRILHKHISRLSSFPKAEALV